MPCHTFSRQSLVSCLGRGLDEVDVLITSGGVSMGEKVYVCVCVCACVFNDDTLYHSQCSQYTCLYRDIYQMVREGGGGVECSFSSSHAPVSYYRIF